MVCKFLTSFFWKTYNNSRTARTIIFVLINVAIIPILMVFLFGRLFYNFKFIRLKDDRIGHFTSNTELFLRRLKIGKVKNKNYVGIMSNKPSNHTLPRMIQKKIRVIQIPKLFYKMLILFQTFTRNKSLLHIFDLYETLPFETNEYYEFNNVKPCFRINKNQEKKGEELLKNMKVDSWFVCFHARDSEYIHRTKNREETLNFRNCDINNFLKATQYIAKQGGYAIRMGHIVNEELPHTNLRIIDYASKYRTDFGDIFLPAKCKFFLGNTSGIFLVSTMFNVPVALTNIISFKYPPMGKNDLFIPKKIWNKKEKRFLTFKEMIYLDDLTNHYSGEQYAKSCYEVVENSLEEIFDLVVEMNKRIDGTWETTPQDKALQKKFRSLFKPGHHAYGFPSRIGAVFLRENKDLLS